MKIFSIIVLSFMIPILGNADNYSFPTNLDGKYEFSEVVTSDLSKSSLFNNARRWVMSFFNNYKAVVQVESELDGRIVAKGNYDKFSPKLTFNNYWSFTYERVFFTITIDCKDMKYRYRINDIIIKSIDYHDSPYSDYEREYESEIKHEDHLLNIQSETKRKESIDEKISIAERTLKGRKLKKELESLNTDLEKICTKLVYEKEIYEAEYVFFDTICKSIKRGMAINDDF